MLPLYNRLMENGTSISLLPVPFRVFIHDIYVPGTSILIFTWSVWRSG